MITQFKIFEAIKTGEKFKDDYFKDDLWYVDVLARDYDMLQMKKINKYLINKFKKNNIDYRIYFWNGVDGYGFYFFLNEYNMLKLENIKFIYKLKIKKAPESFEYPSDIEERILTPSNVNMPLDFPILYDDIGKYNL